MNPEPLVDFNNQKMLLGKMSRYKKLTTQGIKSF